MKSYVGSWRTHGLFALASCSDSGGPVDYGGRPGTPDPPPLVAGTAFGHDLAVHTELGRAAALGGLGLAGASNVFAFTRDPASGDLFGAGNDGDPVRIERDDTSSTLVGVDAMTNELVRIDRTSAARTVVGPLGVADAEGRAFDLATLRGLGSSVATRQLLVSDHATGAAKPLGGTGFDPRGLAERRP